jgi:hypothetical protein
LVFALTAWSCSYSSPVIGSNNIRDNSANGVQAQGGGKGGGIYCWDESQPLIINNSITGNSSNQSGGGIRLQHFTSTISGNIIAGNLTRYAGGGISSYYSASTLLNNTITGNQMTENPNGGGIYCYQSSPVITNTIFWDNLPDEIYSGDPVVSYSDIEGGYPGEGNINADPLFVDPDNGDYCLTEESPCIDAGDPSSPLDPDSTRADIGACYFDQGPLSELSISMIPDTTNFQRGDTLCFTATMTNNTDSTIFFQAWTECEAPWGRIYSPLLGPVSMILGPGGEMSPHVCRQLIPSNTPLGGPYIYCAKVGIYPGGVIDEDLFEFYVVPPEPLLELQKRQNDYWELSILTEW